MTRGCHHCPAFDNILSQNSHVVTQQWHLPSVSRIGIDHLDELRNFYASTAFPLAFWTFGPVLKFCVLVTNVPASLLNPGSAC